MKDDSPEKVASVILSGGQGTRLFPLTLNHCKPAVSFAGRYRLIDIPLSNSINSGIDRIFVLAQYLTSELEHHLSQTYQFDHFNRGSIDFLTPQELPNGEKVWYEGTADSVRKNIETLLKAPVDYFLILSGDQLYNIDFEQVISYTVDQNADLTVLALPVKEAEAKRMGLLKVDEHGKILNFYEKPQEQKILDDFELKDTFYKDHQMDPKNGAHYLGSMGIYVFKRKVLEELLDIDKREDFGKHLIPTQIERGNSVAFVYQGYWEDIGTIRSFYEANLMLTTSTKGLNTYDERNPIYGRFCHLPGPKIHKTNIENSIICEGAIIEADQIIHSIIGLRVHIKRGTIIKDSIIMGHHYYLRPSHQAEKLPDKFEIGENCTIEQTIIDEHVQIGNDVRLTNEKNLDTYDGDGVFIRDGIIVVTTGTIIPDGFVL